MLASLVNCNFRCRRINGGGGGRALVGEKWIELNVQCGSFAPLAPSLIFQLNIAYWLVVFDG